VTAFSACQVPDKETDMALEYEAPDFSVACITFDTGVVARLTCSIIAPHDHTLRIIGDEGILSTHDCWDYRSPVRIQRPITIRRKTFMSPMKMRYRLCESDHERYRSRGSTKMDYARGVSEFAASIRESRPCRLSARYCLHTTEVVIAIDHARALRAPYAVTTTFDPVDPMPWAR
jgi:hypothetical protein